MAKRQYNRFQLIGNGEAEIVLTQGKRALVDTDDLPKLLRWKWCAHHERGRWYALSRKSIAQYKTTLLRMHRIILNAPDGMDVDHANRDGLDNRRCNLRLASRSENLANSEKRSGTRSKYKGVMQHPRTKRWRAKFSVAGETLHLGYFDTEEGAAQAYNKAALKHFGEFARLNPVRLGNCGVKTNA